MSRESESFDFIRHTVLSYDPGVELFSHHVSLDGRVPITERVIRKDQPKRVRSSGTIYSMTESGLYAASSKPAKVVEDPFGNGVTEHIILRGGGTEYKIVQNEETEEIESFSLLIRPQLRADQVQSLSIYSGMGKNLLEELYNMVPVCEVDSEKGLQLLLGEDFLFGFGPHYADEDYGVSGWYCSEELKEQIENGKAMLSVFDRKNVHVEFTVDESEAELFADDDAMKGMFSVKGGLIVHRSSFAKVRRDCINLFNEITADNTDEFLEIVEPYVSLEFSPSIGY